MSDAKNTSESASERARPRAERGWLPEKVCRQCGTILQVVEVEFRKRQRGPVTLRLLAWRICHECHPRALHPQVRVIPNDPPAGSEPTLL
jgi:hypothetical protein